MNYRNFLTPEEREECWRAGFVRKMASCGIRPSECGIEKDADFASALSKVWGVGKDMFKGTIGIGLLGGLPLGAILHFVDRAVKNDSKETERLVKTRDTYLDVVAEIKRKLEQDKAKANKAVALSQFT